MQEKITSKKTEKHEIEVYEDRGYGRGFQFRGSIDVYDNKKVKDCPSCNGYGCFMTLPIRRNRTSSILDSLTCTKCNGTGEVGKYE